MQKHEGAPPLVDTTETAYQVGQVWKYRHRPQEPDSVLTIAKVEKMHGTTIAVHVSVQGLHLKPVNTGGIPGHTASHLPFSASAIAASVTELVEQSTTVAADYQQCYELWKQAFLKGKAGVFDAPVAEVIDLIEQTTSNN